MLFTYIICVIGNFVQSTPQVRQQLTSVYNGITWTQTQVFELRLCTHATLSDIRAFRQ